MEEQILVLNKLGFNVVKIINPIDNTYEVFLYNSFSPVDSLGGQTKSYKHIIKGKNITKFLHDRASALRISTSQLEENVLRSNIDVLPIINIEYSSHYLWINYLIGR